MYSNLASWKSSFSWDAAGIFSKSVSSFHEAEVTNDWHLTTAFCVLSLPLSTKLMSIEKGRFVLLYFAHSRKQHHKIPQMMILLTSILSIGSETFAYCNNVHVALDVLTYQTWQCNFHSILISHHGCCCHGCLAAWHQLRRRGSFYWCHDGFRQGVATGNANTRGLRGLGTMPPGLLKGCCALKVLNGFEGLYNYIYTYIYMCVIKYRRLYRCPFFRA